MFPPEVMDHQYSIPKISPPRMGSGTQKRSSKFSNVTGLGCASLPSVRSCNWHLDINRANGECRLLYVSIGVGQDFCQQIFNAATVPVSIKEFF